MSTGAALAVIGQLMTPAAGDVSRAAPPNLTEVTRCLAGAIAQLAGTEICIAVVRQPCARLDKAEGETDTLPCLDALSARYAAYAQAVLERRAPTMPASAHSALAARLAEELGRSDALCREATSPPGKETGIAFADCRLHRAAALAHLVEFHPKRLAPVPAAEA